MISKPTKSDVMRELRDYIFITLGLISYAGQPFLFLIRLLQVEQPVSVPSSIMQQAFLSNGLISSSMLC